MTKPDKAPILIGIAGLSCSGKSSLASALAQRLVDAAIVSTDFYYKDLSALSPTERKEWNFDHPQAVDSESLVRDLGTLAQGASIQCPVYDFASHTRFSDQTTTVEPRKYIIVEGLFVLYWPDLRRLLQKGIFVSTAEGVCFERRKTRDVRERGRDIDSVVAQYRSTVSKMGEQYVLPSRKFADLVIDGEAPLSEAVPIIISSL